MMNSLEVMDSAIQLFPREDGTISIWDHPNFKSSLVLPDQYTPLTRVEQGLEKLQKNGQSKTLEERLMVLKVVGDAICANENQLRRYLSAKLSYSKTSEYLKELRKHGFVERHKSRLAFIDEDDETSVKPPAPYTLGIAGYKVMNHLYSGQAFAHPDTWQQNSLGVQRYTAMNEVRCLSIESKNVKGWKWFPYIGGKTKYKRPLAVAKVNTPKGELQMIFDRAQMSQDFISYFRERLEVFRYLHDRDKCIVIDEHKRIDFQIYILSCSTVSMANYIQEQLRLHTYPFDVMILVDEWMETEYGLGTALASVSKEGIKRQSVGFLMKVSPNV